MVQTVTRSDIRHRKINGLRLLADALEANPDLSVPEVRVIADTAEEVHRAAGTQSSAVVFYSGGHTTASLIFDGISMHLVHVDDEAMADYHARNSYARSVQP